MNSCMGPSVHSKNIARVPPVNEVQIREENWAKIQAIWSQKIKWPKIRHEMVIMLSAFQLRFGLYSQFTFVLHFHYVS